MKGIALFSLWSQKVVLKEVGEIYVKHNATECNVFRGSETCLAAPDYSNYIKTCNSKNKPVDCAFKSFITKGSFEGLSLVPQQYVGAEGKNHFDGTLLEVNIIFSLSASLSMKLE